MCFDLWIFTPYLYTSNTTGMNHLKTLYTTYSPVYLLHKISFEQNTKPSLYCTCLFLNIWSQYRCFYFIVIDDIPLCFHTHNKTIRLFPQEHNSILLLLLLLLLLLSSVSPLCRVSTLIFLRQTMSLGNIVLQLFLCNYSWCVYR